ncbi:MAG: Hsp70 family protein [Deltaproteobacteria bacterium]|nr:Hsp70 family protein [Deltaproteobacteria bacterium]
MSAEPKLIVGIDLGTTYSLVAVLQAGVPVVLPNALGERLTPSAVSVLDDGRVVVGAAARARAVLDPRNTALAFKRDMGTERLYELRGESFRPQQLSALILAALKQDAEAALGRPIEEAVVSVPAYFGELQRQATRDAAAIAGLHVERIVNEPTAAALAYGLRAADNDQRVVVFDLGGGTLDVSVLEIVSGVIEVQATAGDVRLGGEDFTDALAELAASRLDDDDRAELREHPIGWARLREACEGAKRRLSTEPAATVDLPDLPFGPGRRSRLHQSITREQAVDAWAPLLGRLRGPTERALRDASLDPGRLDHVLLVGGATRMPCIQHAVAGLFGRPPLCSLPPDEAVAMGAAVQAALKARDSAVADMVVTDVAPFTMGIESSVRMGSQFVGGVFAPILERGTVIPASRVKPFSTVADFQRTIHFKVFQGEHARCADNQQLGEYVLAKLPELPAGKVSVEVRFTYDLNGILEVDLTVGGTDRTETLVIERSPGRLTAEQVEQARQAMKRWKVHPREELPNLTALARAEALFVELIGPEREALGQSIARLRYALDRQDPVLIRQCRELLVAHTTQLLGGSEG